MPYSRLVYSTDGDGRPPRRPRDPQSGNSGGMPAPQPLDRRPAPSTPPVDGVIRIFRERSGRRGKVVTVIRGLPDRGPALEARAAELKRLCGAGGTVKDGAIEIQGDHREQIAERLRAMGLRVKLAGG